MLKQLKLYYLLVATPFVLLLLGSLIFLDAIQGTITKNPHPQINFAIFAIILAGGIFIIINARRLLREARILVEFSSAIHGKTDHVTLQELANSYSGDISCLLQMVAASSGRSISHQEQAAIEHELVNARTRLNRRNALPQYLTGLLVGMGLLGTFIGLLATLNDISVLISSFADLDMNNVNPMQVFRTMIERMKAPMQSMGIAFSASMFGLLGSIVLGLMMVGIRRLQGDIFSLLSSEIARHIEIALSHGCVTAGQGTGGGLAGDEYRVLHRIEERLAESLRFQQRSLTGEMVDLQKQRTEMLRLLADQTETNHQLRGELQQLGRLLADVVGALERGNREVVTQLSDFTVAFSAHSRENNQLLATQVAGQEKLRSTLDSFKIEERLTEANRLQQRALSSEVDEFRKQRSELVRILAEQGEANSGFRHELRQLSQEIGGMSAALGNKNDEIREQIAELMVHLTAEAKESHKLLSLQLNEQQRLRDSLDLRIKGTPAE